MSGDLCDQPAKDTKTDEDSPFKVVVRRLPPSMNRLKFLEIVSPLPKHDCLDFIPAKKQSGEDAFAKVFIRFCTKEDVFTFKEKFDNYIVLDEKGFEYPIVVEWAVNQTGPETKTSIPDSASGTIEKDAEWKRFMRYLSSHTSPPLEESADPGPAQKLGNINPTPSTVYVDSLRMKRFQEIERGPGGILDRKMAIEVVRKSQNVRKKLAMEKDMLMTELAQVQTKLHNSLKMGDYQSFPVRMPLTQHQIEKKIREIMEKKDNIEKACKKTTPI